MSNWLTRLELVQLTGIGLSTIPALERRGLLHPRRVYRCDTRGAERSTVVYAPDEVAKLPRRGRASIDRSPGEVTARAFELFREGRTDEEVVIELRETVDQIYDLREKWINAGGAAWVIVPVAREEFSTNTMLSFQKLDVYQRALQFLVVALEVRAEGLEPSTSGSRVPLPPSLKHVTSQPKLRLVK